MIHTATLIDWTVFFITITGLICLDLFKSQKERSIIVQSNNVLKREGLWSIFWIILSLMFNIYIYWSFGSNAALDFLNGYLIEKSLSVDNIFVFIIIFQRFQLNSSQQSSVLLFGMCCAIVLRGIFIALGISLLQNFDWIFYIFGLVLLISAYKILNNASHQSQDIEFITWIQKYIPVKSDIVTDKLWIKSNGKWQLTPLFIVLIAIGITDIVFAIDSIPAIFAITQDSYIVWTSNVFALLGLRSLFIVLKAWSQRFVYLTYGLALILAFVGIKMILHSIFPINNLISLGIIMTILGMTCFLSFKKTKNSV